MMSGAGAVTRPWAGPSVAFDAATRHAQELLLQGRCCHCAESVPARVVLNGAACPKCRRTVSLGLGSAHVAAMLEQQVGRTRWVIYGCGAGSALLLGWMPFVPSLLRFAFLVAAHVMLVRRPMRWLSTKRRLATTFTLRLMLSAIATFGLLLDVLTIPLPGLNAVVATFVTVGGLLAYAEGGMRYVANRVRREAVSPELDTFEWLLPTLLIGALLAATAGVLLSAAAALYVLTQAPIPSVAQFARWLIGSP